MLVERDEDDQGMERNDFFLPLAQDRLMQDRISFEHGARMVRPGGYLMFGIRDGPRDLPHPSRSWEETEEGIELHEVIAEPCFACKRESSETCIEEELAHNFRPPLYTFALLLYHQ